MGKELKTWQKTKTPGLLRHKTGRYYARFSGSGKTWFEALKTDVLEVANIRFSEAKVRTVKAKRARRDTADGIGKMGDLALLMRKQIQDRTGVSEKTKELNLQSLVFIQKTWPKFDELPPKNLTISAVIEWRDRAIKNGSGFTPPGSKIIKAKGASASTVNKAIDMIRRLLDLAVDTSVLTGNPLTGRRRVKAPNKPKKPDLPEAGVLEKLFREIESIGGRGISTGEFCRGLAYTGCRKTEAATLIWTDLIEARGILKVHGVKTEAAEREVPLIPAARALFEKIRAKRIAENPEFDSSENIFRVREAQKSLDRACAKIGIQRLTHHDLRDAFATLCIESGVDVPTVAAWLGHADGGALLMRTYAHHRRAHSITQAAKVKIKSNE